MLVVEVAPTAQALFAENASTAVNAVDVPAGRGTASRLQADPFQRSATAVPVPSAPVALPTANADADDVARTPDRVAHVFAPRSSRSGLATTLHLVPLNRCTTPLPLPATAHPSVADTAVTSLNPPKKPVDATGTWVAADAYAGAAVATTVPITI